MRILKTLLSDDCKTFVVYSIPKEENLNPHLRLDWANAKPLYECGTKQEADNFVAWVSI